MQNRASENGIQLDLPEGLASTLSGNVKGSDGARQMRRLVQEKVEGPLVSYLLSCGKKPVKVWAKFSDGKLSFKS